MFLEFSEDLNATGESSSMGDNLVESLDTLTHNYFNLFLIRFDVLFSRNYLTLFDSQETSVVLTLGVREVRLRQWFDSHVHSPQSKEAYISTCCSVQPGHQHVCVRHTFPVYYLQWADVRREYIEVIKDDLQVRVIHNSISFETYLSNQDNM